MTKHYCDRCGEETTGESVALLVVADGCPAGQIATLQDWRGVYQANLDTFRRDIAVDLCSECRGELHEWVKPFIRTERLAQKNESVYGMGHSA